MTGPQRPSLRRLLTLPHAVLVLGVAALIGVLSYRAGSRAVDTMSDQLLREIVARIGQAVERHIVVSGAVLEAAFPAGLPAPADIGAAEPELRRRLWIATSLHLDPHNYVYYGNERGQFLGLWRFSEREGELRLRLADNEVRRLYRLDGIAAAPGEAVREQAIFEPRERPWYRIGAANALPIWTPVYVDFRTAELVTTRARRVADANGALAGVVATDLSLARLNDFVRGLHISERGLAFVVEPDGQLIASSRTANVRRADGGANERLAVADAGDAQQLAAWNAVRAALALAGAEPGASESSGAAEGMALHIEGAEGAVEIAYQRLHEAAGLDWITVVAVPRGDFMGDITRNVAETAVVAAVATLLATLLGLSALGAIAADLHRVAEAAHAVGEGRLDAPLTVHRDDEIGELADSFRAMRERLQHDLLTGLVNRETLMRGIAARLAAQRRAADARPFAVLFVDLDDFKSVNDRHGHEAGDKVLAEVGHRLRRGTRAGDLVARYAGDEFVVLLDDVASAEAAEQSGRHLAAELRRPIEGVAAAGGPLVVTASIGVALGPQEGDTAETLLARADADMYTRKPG